jgi:hypothetical protein
MATTNIITHKVADGYRLWHSKPIVSPVAGTYNVIAIPRYTLVKEVYLDVTTAFAILGSITIGFSGNSQTANAAYFMDEAMAEATATGTKVALAAKYFGTLGGFITVTVVAGATTGTFSVFADATLVR